MTTNTTTQEAIQDLRNDGILSEYCHHHTGKENGGWMCRQCHTEQGTLHLLELADNRQVREEIASLDFVPAMVALGYIEDTHGVIDAFINGLLTENEGEWIEQELQKWQMAEVNV